MKFLSSSSSSLRLFVLTAFSMLMNHAVLAQNRCSLCANAAVPVSSRLQQRPSGSSQTCSAIYLNLFQTTVGTNACTNGRRYRNWCCNANSGGSGNNRPVASPTIPPYRGPVGREPVCRICRTSQYPGIPNAFIVARYVGEYTCAQLYGRGNHGMIPSFMCGALQDFAASICGCGVYNPNRRSSTSSTSEVSVSSATPGTRALRGDQEAGDESSAVAVADESTSLAVVTTYTASSDSETQPEYELHFETRELSPEELEVQLIIEEEENFLMNEA